MAKRVGAIQCIEEEHEADERTIDGRRGKAFRKQVVAIGFGIGNRHLGGFETRMFLLQPASKASHILGV